MPTDSQYKISYFMVMVRHIVYVVFYEIFQVEICMTFTFRIWSRSNVSMQIKRKSISDIVSDGSNCKVSHICYHLWDIFSRNMHNLDHYIWNGSRSNANMSFDWQCWTFYLMVLVLFAISVTVYEIFEVEMCMTLTTHKHTITSTIAVGKNATTHIDDSCR